MNKILIVEARSCIKISSISSKIINEMLLLEDVKFQRINVERVVDIPNAVNLILDAQEFNAVVILGYVIDDNSSRAQVLYQECLNKMNDITIYHTVVLGFGLAIADSNIDAEIKAPNNTKEAIKSCMTLLKLRKRFLDITEEQDNDLDYMQH